MTINDRSIPVTISMGSGLALELRILAAKEGKSRSQYVREKLEHLLKSKLSEQDNIERSNC
jgi:hypothetical protein